MFKEIFWKMLWILKIDILKKNMFLIKILVNTLIIFSKVNMNEENNMLFDFFDYKGIKKKS